MNNKVALLILKFGILGIYLEYLSKTVIKLFQFNKEYTHVSRGVGYGYLITCNNIVQSTNQSDQYFQFQALRSLVCVNMLYSICQLSFSGRVRNTLTDHTTHSRYYGNTGSYSGFDGTGLRRSAFCNLTDTITFLLGFAFV